jgi:hypothetical protein
VLARRVLERAQVISLTRSLQAFDAIRRSVPTQPPLPKPGASTLTLAVLVVDVMCFIQANAMPVNAEERAGVLT